MDVTSKPLTQNTSPKTCATRSAGITAITRQQSNRPLKKAATHFVSLAGSQISGPQVAQTSVCGVSYALRGSSLGGFSENPQTEVCATSRAPFDAGRRQFSHSNPLI